MYNFIDTEEAVCLHNGISFKSKEKGNAEISGKLIKLENIILVK